MGYLVHTMYTVLFGKPAGKRLLEGPMCRWAGDVKMTLT
jgi:hypothetical protein